MFQKDHSCIGGEGVGGLLISLPVASETAARRETRGEERGRRDPRGGARTANGLLFLALSADTMHAGHTSRLPSHLSLRGLANQMHLLGIRCAM
jgi:hypothetical protein